MDENIEKQIEENRRKVKQLIDKYVKDSIASGNVDENGKIIFFPKICDTPDLILEKFPMTEEQIMSVDEYNEGLRLDAIDFLHGETKSKIASTMYMCIYAKYHGLKEL